MTIQLLFLTMLLVFQFSGPAFGLGKGYIESDAIDAETRQTLERKVYWKPLPELMKSYVALFLKLPRQAPTVLEGALWLHRPQTVTFEAVNDFANTLFYFRFTEDRGWIIDQGSKQKKIKFPVDGKTLLHLVMGRPPPLPKKLYRIHSDSKHGPAEEELLVGDHDELWTFSREHLPLAYRRFSRRAYRVEWSDWQERAAFFYPRRILLHNKHGSFQLKITLHESELR